VAAVLVHIDLDGERPHAASALALAAGRAVASSWGATLYAAVIVQASGEDPAPVPGDRAAIEEVRLALTRGGADKIVVAKTTAAIEPLWSAVGSAWQGVLEHLRPRLVVFGADAPSAAELGPRTAARIGARLLMRARARGSDDVELRDRDRGSVRASDGGAAVVLIGAAAAIEVPGDPDIDVMVLVPPGGADPRIELASTQPAELGYTLGTLVAIGDDAARDPEIAQATQRLARALGAHVIGGAAAASAGVVEPGGVVERGAPLAPEMCVVVGQPAIDLAGAACRIAIGGMSAKDGERDSQPPGAIAASLGDLARLLEDR
jgi:hypothetical protein